jgi:hypothetical protein
VRPPGSGLDGPGDAIGGFASAVIGFRRRDARPGSLDQAGVTDVLQLDGVTKRFGRTVALDGCSFHRDR